MLMPSTRIGRHTQRSNSQQPAANKPARTAVRSGRRPQSSCCQRGGMSYGGMVPRRRIFVESNGRLRGPAVFPRFKPCTGVS